MYVLHFILPILFLLPQVQPPSYEDEIALWRRERQAMLKADGSWLDVAGLFWLKPGANTVGADPASDIVLPKDSAPPVLGRFLLENEEVVFEPRHGAAATLNSAPATRHGMKADVPGPPDILGINSLTLFVIRRGNRTGIRLKDANSTARRSFAGLKYFPIRPAFRLKAKYTPYDQPRRIPIANILGDTNDDVTPGYVEFNLGGKRCRMEPVLEGAELFFIFKDKTAGRETYPAGRYVYAELPKAGEVILDFNKAINPPCAFTPFATCPLPPRQNRLAVRIEAGEMTYGH